MWPFDIAKKKREKELMEQHIKMEREALQRRSQFRAVTPASSQASSSDSMLDPLNVASPLSPFNPVGIHRAIYSSSHASAPAESSYRSCDSYSGSSHSSHDSGSGSSHSSSYSSSCDSSSSSSSSYDGGSSSSSSSSSSDF